MEVHSSCLKLALNKIVSVRLFDNLLRKKSNKQEFDSSTLLKRSRPVYEILADRDGSCLGFSVPVLF